MFGLWGSADLLKVKNHLVPRNSLHTGGNTGLGAKAATRRCWLVRSWVWDKELFTKNMQLSGLSPPLSVVAQMVQKHQRPLPVVHIPLKEHKLAVRMRNNLYEIHNFRHQKIKLFKVFSCMITFFSH